MTEDKRPCRGVNSNVCVAEGCYGEACLRVLDGPSFGDYWPIAATEDQP